jgi:hypothetical protein
VSAADRISATPADRRGLPSSGQARMWLLHHTAPPGSYHIHAFFTAPRIEGVLLDAAAAAVARRHEALRATFALTVDGLRQVVRANAPGYALRVAPRDDRVAAERVLEASLATSFDLECGPLLRVALLPGDGVDRVAITIHHIAADGWSMGLLADELWRAYDDLAAGCEPRLGPPPASYLDYAQRQQAWLASDDCAEQLAFWRERLRGAPPEIPLPARADGAGDDGLQGAEASTRLPAATVAALSALGEHHGTTPFMTLLALYAALLSELSGADDLVVAIPALNRPEPELEDMLGYFTNTVPVRLKGVRDAALPELLHQTRERSLEAYAHHEVPFEAIVRAVGAGRAPGRVPLANVAFALEQEPGSLPGGVRRAAGPVPLPARFDLTLQVTVEADELVLTMYYDAGRLAAGDVDAWLAALRRQVEAASMPTVQEPACQPI